MRPKTPRSLLSTPSIAAPIPTRPDALHRQSQSPYRFLVPFSEVQLDEKQPGSELPHIPPSSSRSSPARRMPPRIVSRTPTPTPEVVQHTYGYPAPTRTPLPAPCTLAAEARHSLWRRAWHWFKPWIPISLWVATSVGFLLAIAFWRTEVFEGLDNFSHWLQEDGWEGYAILGVLIFITTIPPFPLYSTFMTLSGYAFGALPGAVISYIASLVGAVTVFLLSRAYLSDYIGSFFERSPSFKRVVRAIEKRPNVLFLVRLAPYPYNVMNVLLAASPTLTLRTYTICTGLALFKVIIHTTLGASIHSFSHHGGSTAKPADGETGSETPADDEDEDSTMSRALQIGGIVLCVGVFLYISWVARRAVDNEADDDDDRAQNAEEREAFLPRGGRDSASSGDLMTEADLGHNEPRSVARMHFIDTTSTTDIVVVPSPSPSPRPLSR